MECRTFLSVFVAAFAAFVAFAMVQLPGLQQVKEVRSNNLRSISIALHKPLVGLKLQIKSKRVYCADMFEGEKEQKEICNMGRNKCVSI
jgi:hypothetical protein